MNHETLSLHEPICGYSEDKHFYSGIASGARNDLTDRRRWIVLMFGVPGWKESSTHFAVMDDFGSLVPVRH